MADKKDAELHGLGAVRALGLAGFVLLAAAGQAAQASEHLMAIQEVFVGTPVDGVASGLTPNQRAQYVMLRMTASGQTFVAGDPIRVEDKDGNILGNFGTFPSNVASGGTVSCTYPTCPALILGTQAAKNLFTFNFDAIVDSQAGRVALPAEGGRACWKDGGSNNVYDCVAWGNFSCKPANCSGPNTLHIGDSNLGNGCDSNYDTPAAVGTGLQYGKSLVRTSFSCPSKNNATQFTLAFPKPVANSGANNNTDTDGDGLIDVLDCNDANSQIEWPATEVQNLRVTLTTSTTSLDAWDSQAATAGPGVTYDEVRGVAPGLGGAACHNANTSTASSPDPDIPAAGGAFWYLVRAGAGAGCVGTYGAGRDGVIGAVCP